MNASKVYFTDFRCREGLNRQQKLEKLCIRAGFDKIDFDGKFVAIKIHFGELGNLAFLRPNYAKTVADMATISVDLLRVREIFINLLSNAIKFTPEGGRIEFIVECLRLEPDSVYDRITVRDNGVGMLPSRQLPPAGSGSSAQGLTPA